MLFWRASCLVLLGALAACGGSSGADGPDPATQLAGTWQGEVSLVAASGACIPPPATPWTERITVSVAGAQVTVQADPPLQDFGTTFNATVGQGASFDAGWYVQHSVTASLHFEATGPQQALLTLHHADQPFSPPPCLVVDYSGVMVRVP